MIEVQYFFDAATSTLTYVVWDPESRDAVVIDPVLDYDPAGSQVSETSAKMIIDFVQSRVLKPQMILETHCHADHISGAQVLKKNFPQALIGIGAEICAVQKIFKTVFDFDSSFATDGSQFDRLFKDGEIVTAGHLQFQVIYTPGHTPACASYRFGDQAIFVGDGLFMPDYGTARCDFPAGDAHRLFKTITERLYTLPPSMLLYTGHDYQPNGRELQFAATIQLHRDSNVHLNAKTNLEDFVRFRTARDKTLSAPKLLYPSVQLNLTAGRLPEPRANGHRYLNIPIQTST